MYYIYHIPGIKIGCSIDIDARVKVQGYKDYEVLEEHADVYTASNREIFLQKKYGYAVDTMPYWQTINLLGNNPKRIPAMQNSKLYKQARKKCGNDNKENGHMKELANKFNSSKEHQSKAGKIAGSVERTCPYCNKIVKGPSYFVFHGEKCKSIK